MIKLNSFKALFLASIILAATVSLGGCSTNPVENLGESTITRSYQGELTFLTAPFGGLEVTHLLITEARHRVYLKSLTQDLDQYAGKTVRVSGVYTQEEVSTKQVDILQVEKVDILSEPETVSETEFEEVVLNNETLSVKFSYNGELFTESSNGELIKLNGASETDTLSVKRFDVSDQLNIESYANIKYEDVDFTKTQLSNGLQALTNYPGIDGNLVYLIQKDPYFFKFELLNSDDTTFQTYIDEVQAIVNSAIFTAEAVEADDEEDTESDENTEEADENEVQEDITYPSFSSVELGKQTVINNFQKEAFSMDLEGTFKDIESYGFAGDNYFYVTYGQDEERFRALIKYENDSDFELIAKFKQGTVTDWEIVTGQNLAANLQLTLILVGEENDSAKEVSVEQGYRYYESLAMGFGVQYPQQWYYARTDNVFFFSDQPIGEGENLIELSETDDDFAKLSGTSIKSNVKKVTSGSKTTYYVALDDDTTIKIEGESEYDSKMLIMANSVIVVE